MVWYRSIGFKGTLILVAMAIGILITVLTVINTNGKTLVSNESSKLIEQIGNVVVNNLNDRSIEISALVRTIATTSQQLEKDEKLFHKVFPPIFDFNGNLRIAGGGIWPEPKMFDHTKERRSFFWGRTDEGDFKYYDDYNAPEGNGYHNEEWYVPLRYTKPGYAFWSKSYMDPYSFQPMVTCTVGTYDNNQLTGTATVDLKLEGIEDTIRELQKKSGGYIALLDRNGKFISFPEAGDKAKIFSKDEDGKTTEDFMTVREFSQGNPFFTPIANEISMMNQYILQKAEGMPHFDPEIAKKIDQDSYQINAEEAEFIASMLLDPLKEKSKQSNLYKKFEIENDAYVNGKAVGYLFHVPKTYWKLIIIKPFSETISVAVNLAETLILKISFMIILLTVMGYFALKFLLVKPVSKITGIVKKADSIISSGKYRELKNIKIDINTRDELYVLSNVFKTLSKGFLDAHEVIEEQNRTLEHKVEKRTEELKGAYKELAKAKDLAEESNEQITKSIEYASLIQSAILPNVELFPNFFNESFVIWEPKDIVGGDIYFSIEINENECVIMVIDCTGHGIPGAFVTMLVKAIEIQITANIREGNQLGPSQILSFFNKSIKTLLKQDHTQSLSNAGFDGGILHYNKKEKILKFAGAETSLLCIEEGKMQTLKGDRHSVGYKRSEANYKFKEHSFKVKEGMQFYLATDGYSDQIGGERGFSFGTTKFTKLLCKHHKGSFTEQKENLLKTLSEYQGDEDRTDDITIVGIKI